MNRDQERARIDDLDQPQFQPDAWAILNGLAEAGKGLAFEPDRLCQTAMDQTGLDRWGDTAFRERLDILCRALTSEGRLSDYGKAATWEGLLQLLRNRLRVEDLFAQFPEIEDVPVPRPIVICGQPRTGTTHLHNLLSADPALRHLPYWESLEPVLPRAEWSDPDDPRRGYQGTTPDPRLARTQVAVDVVDLCMPLFKRMHEMTVDHTHEEIELLAIDIAGMSFETTSLLPSWRDHYKATDQTPSYRYLRRVLQALTWLQGGSRWVLKSPQHLEQYQPLLATFPDATFVVTHRDPVAVAVSVCTMLAYAARMRTDRPDIPAITRYWVDRNADLLEACMDDHHLLPPDQTVDIRFADFMADEMGTVEQIYAAAGQPLDDRARQAMASYVSTHPRGRHGTVAYEPETLGIDPDPIRERLQHYAIRFGV